MARASLRTLFSWLDEIPWALVVFLAIAIGGFYLKFSTNDLSWGEYLAAASVGAGLHGVGHGIRKHASATQSLHAHRHEL